jgi:hypothetical protein
MVNVDRVKAGKQAVYEADSNLPRPNQACQQLMELGGNYAAASGAGGAKIIF